MVKACGWEKRGYGYFETHSVVEDLNCIIVDSYSEVDKFDPRFQICYSSSETAELDI